MVSREQIMEMVKKNGGTIMRKDIGAEGGQLTKQLRQLQEGGNIKLHHDPKGVMIELLTEWERKVISKYKLTKKDGKTAYVHRVIMERKLGRKLQSNESVHHINGDKTDNREENLELSTKIEHPTIHRDKELENKAVILYATGISTTEVAIKLEVSQATVKRWLSEQGVEAKSYKRWLIPKVIELYRVNKFTNKKIAEMVGIEEHAVGRWIKKYA